MSPTLISILVTSYTLLLGIIAFLVKDKLKNLETRIKDLENEVTSMRTNYLARFENVKEHISAKVDELKEAINSIKINLAKIEE